MLFAMLFYQFICNMILIRRCFMAFQLKTDKKYTENKTIRFPLDLIQRIEENIKGKNVSFSSFVIQACEYAVSDLEHEKKKD